MYYASCRIKARTHHITAHCPYCIIILCSLNCCFISITCILYITCYYIPFTTGYSSIYYISFGSFYFFPVYLNACLCILKFAKCYICKCLCMYYASCRIKARTHHITAHCPYCIIILCSLNCCFISITCILYITCYYTPFTTGYSSIYYISFGSHYRIPVYFHAGFYILEFSEFYICKCFYTCYTFC